MIKITIRDGRVCRRVAEDGKGEVLVTTEAADFLDIGSKIRLPDGVDVLVIGDEIEIRRESAQQTVYIGNLPTPVAVQPKTIRFDVGGNDGWSLQRANGDSAIFIRTLDDAEVEKIDAAAAFCREHVISPVYRLLASSHQVWKQTYDRVAEAKREELSPALSGELLGALAGWLLTWRLILDQSAHNISQRFGRESAQFADFRATANRAYDSSQAYRVVEALRNEVQHREMPPLEVRRTKTLDRTTGQIAETFSCKFPVSYLLESEKCKNKSERNSLRHLALPSMSERLSIAPC